MEYPLLIKKKLYDYAHPRDYVLGEPALR